MLPDRHGHGNGKPPRGARIKRDLKPRPVDCTYSPWPDDVDDDYDGGDEDAYECVAERMRQAASGSYEEDEPEPARRSKSAADGEPFEPPRPQLKPRRPTKDIDVHEYDDEPAVEEEPPPVDPRSGGPGAETDADDGDD